MTALLYCLLLTTTVALCNGDYECMCSQHVTRNVWPHPNTNSMFLTVMDLGDCLPIVNPQQSATWVSVFIDNAIGYVQKDAQTIIQTCPGSPYSAATTTTDEPSTTGAGDEEITTEPFTMEPVTMEPVTVLPTQMMTEVYTETTEIPFSVGNLSKCSVHLRHHYGRSHLVQYKHKCLRVDTRSKSWPDAEKICHHYSGHLVHITNDKYNTFVSQFLHHFNVTSPVWMGLNDQNTENHFKWTSGHDTTYFNWSPDRHDGSHNHHDCVLYLTSMSGYWQDVNCNGVALDSQSFPFVCMYPLGH